MDAVDAQTFAFSALNAIPKIALGKWSSVLSDDGKALILSDETLDRVVPLGTSEDYYRSLISLLEGKRKLALVPEHFASILKRGGFKVTRQHDEYITRTEVVRTLPGNSNRSARCNVNAARRVCSVEDFDTSQVDEYKALVKLWYRQNAETKFRTYDKTSNDWLLENMGLLRAAVPDISCIGIRHEGRLLSVNMACQLTGSMWTSYTRRFDREAQVKSAAVLGYTSHATLFSNLEYENNGTADTKTIRDVKERLVHHKLSKFMVSCK